MSVPLYLCACILTWACVLHAQETKPPLPEVGALLERITIAAKAQQNLREAYCHIEEEEEKKIDAHGIVKERKARTYQVTRLPQGRIRRLIAENGVPLSLERAQAEDARVQEALAKLATTKAAEGKREGTSVSRTKDGAQISLTLSDIANVLEIRKIARTTFRGLPALSIDFAPRKGVKTSGLGQRFASKVEGRLLMEEATDQIMHAEGRLVESCWVGGELLGAVAPPTHFSFDMDQVAPGVWMPSHYLLTLHARITFVPYRRELQTRYRDYRRFVIGDTRGEALDKR